MRFVRFVTSKHPEGPYRPTELNSFWPAYSFHFPRCYYLPGGNLYTEMFHVHREGRKSYHTPPLKILLQCGNGRDFALVIAPDNSIRLGHADKNGSHFRYENMVNPGIDFGTKANFRLVIRKDMGEFYLNDYQISLMNLSGLDRLTGRIGFFGFDFLYRRLTHG